MMTGLGITLNCFDAKHNLFSHSNSTTNKTFCCFFQDGLDFASTLQSFPQPRGGCPHKEEKSMTRNHTSLLGKMNAGGLDASTED